VTQCPATWVALLVAVAACRSTPRPPAPVERALRDLRAGDEARAGGSPAAAAALYRQAAAEARATDRRDLAADADYRLGLARLAAGKPAEAVQALEPAAEEARRARELRLAARSYLALARARQDAGQPGVEAALRRALEQGEAAEDPVARALALVGLASSAEPAEARSLLERAAGLAGADPAVRCPLALQRARRAERDGAEAGPLFLSAAGECAGQEDFGALHLALAGAARAADASPGPEAALGAADLHRRAAAAARAAGWTPAAASSLRAAASALRRAGHEEEAAELERELRAAAPGP